MSLMFFKKIKMINFPKYLLFFIVFLLLQNCGQNSDKIPTKNSKKTFPIKVEKTLPILSAVYNSFDSLEYIFHQKNDTVYVINFWATWCAPCVAELPYFEYMNKVYKNKKVRVVLISLDTEKSIDNKLRPFIKKEKLLAHVIALTDTDYDIWGSKVDADWDITIPATVIYCKNEYQFIGGEFESYQELDTIVQSFLAVSTTEKDSLQLLNEY